MEEISQQPQITDTYTNTEAEHRATKMASYILMTSRRCDKPMKYNIIMQVSIEMYYYYYLYSHEELTFAVM